MHNTLKRVIAWQFLKLPSEDGGARGGGWLDGTEIRRLEEIRRTVIRDTDFVLVGEVSEPLEARRFKGRQAVLGDMNWFLEGEGVKELFCGSLVMGDHPSSTRDLVVMRIYSWMVGFFMMKLLGERF